MKTKDLFLMMSEQEVSSSNYFLNKKEIEFSSKEFAKNLIEAGEIDKFEAFAQAERIALATANVRDEIKKHLPREKHSFFGIEITPVTGRTMIQFQDDLVWAELKEKLSQREELLKVALKTNEPFYDSEGVEVPKVGVKYASDSLNVKY